MANWMITVRPPFSRWLVEGIKTMEIRTRIPNELDIDDYVYVVEAASGGKVIGSFIVKKIIIAHPWFLAKPYYKQHRIPYEMFVDYVGKREEICAIELELSCVLNSMATFKDYGLSRAPQWFAKLSD
jgi:predicted transcriptional regulator